MSARYTLTSSRFLSISLILLYFLADTAVWLTQLSARVQVALTALLLFGLSYQLYRHVLLRADASWQTMVLSGRQLTVRTRAGEEFTGSVTGGTVVMPLAVFLGVVPEGKRLPLYQAIFFDAMPAEAFRALRVQLKFSSDTVA